MKKNYLFFLFFSAFCFITEVCWAEEYSDDEDIIIVSAGKIEQSLDDSVEHVQVLTDEEIKESGAKTLTEAIKNIPGVSVKTASAGNPTDSISMQGFSSSYVKILVNGIEVSGDIAGSPAVFSIPLEDVDHIEVIQGASSSLYGSDAMGGVINIITKKNEASDDEIKFTGSVKEEFSASIVGDLRSYTGLQLKLALMKLTANVSGSFDYAPGAKKKTNDVLAGLIDYYLTPAKTIGYVRSDLTWNEKWGNVGLYGLYNYADQLSNFSPIGFDKSSTMEYDTKRAEGGFTGELDVGDKLVFSGFTSGKYFNLFTEQITKSVSQSSVKDDHTQSVEWESEQRLSWKPDQINTVLMGLHENLETIDGDSFTSLQYQWLLSTYVQDTVLLMDDRISLVPGGRFDFSPSINGSSMLFQLTPKLSVKYDIDENNVLRFAYGMGYKVPTLKQKYWVFRHSYSSGAGNFILNGNPDLKSETSQSLSLRYDSDIKNLIKLESGIYFNYINNMISSVVTDAVSDPQVRTYVNINTAITYGGDIALSSSLDRFDWKLSYAYTSAFEKTDDGWEPLPLRVTHSIGVSAGYLVPVAEIKIRIDGEWNSRQLISSDDDGDLYTPDYLMVGAYIGKSFINDSLEVYLRGDNLLNNFSFVKGTDGSDQKSYYGLDAGTSFTFGVSYKW